MAQEKSQRGASGRAAGRKSTARRSSRSRASQKPDAIRLLKEDHQKVLEMFDRFERTRGNGKERLASTICEELQTHTRLEEEVFYPAAREAIGDDDLMNEAEIEHGSAKELIRQIEASSASDPHFHALVTVLGEYVKHHVKEEEGEMFKLLRASGLDLVELGGQMREWKQKARGDARLPTGRIASLLGG